MTGRRRGGRGSHDTSSRSTSSRPAEHDPPPARHPARSADGVGTDVDALDGMADRLDATRGRVESAAATVRDVHLGPQSMGIIGSGFTGAAEAHVRQAEQQLARTTEAIDQAHQRTRTTAAAYRDTDATSAAQLSAIDTTTRPPTTHGGTPAQTAGGSSPPAPPHRPPEDASTGSDSGWHGEGDLHLTPAEHTAANDFLARAQRAEPEITHSMQAIAEAVPGSDLVGLDYRLKTEDSFKRKLTTAIEFDPDVSVADHLADMKDSVRYTLRISEDSYTSGVQHAVQTLRDNGYESVTFKNTWGSDGYQGINSTWRDPHTGHIFEVQFHTPHSFDAKMITHDLYEQSRLPGVSAEIQRDLARQQNEIFSTIPRPPGAPAISLRQGRNMP